MAILAIEGFTGIPRASRNYVDGTADPLATLGWTLVGRYSGTNVITGDGNVQTQITADPVFATRNVFKMAKTQASTVSLLYQAKLAIDTRGYGKFVFGGLFQYDCTGTDNAIDIIIGGPTLWTTSNGAVPSSDMFAVFTLQNSGASGTIRGVMGNAQTVTRADIVKGKPIHFEVFLEEDAKRCRVYVNGELALDQTLASNYTFAKADSGCSVLMSGYSGTTSAAFTVSWSNIYFLGADAIHTGPVGPAARVLEVAPTQDKTIEWQRPASFASNSAVLQQNFNESAPAYITAGDPATDLYGVINAVSANAAKIYGAAIKVQAQSMAEGTHNITSVAQSGTDTSIGTKNYPLTLLVPKPFVMDVSKNPTTGVAWTPTEITAASIGFRLVN